jgi:hypothetical protein
VVQIQVPPGAVFDCGLARLVYFLIVCQSRCCQGALLEVVLLGVVGFVAKVCSAKESRCSMLE